MYSYSLFTIEETKLPPPTIFGKSLYTFYIGQNDFTGNLASIGISGVKQYLPQVISQISSTIKVKLRIKIIDRFLLKGAILIKLCLCMDY